MIVSLLSGWTYQDPLHSQLHNSLNAAMFSRGATFDEYFIQALEEFTEQRVNRQLANDKGACSMQFVLNLCSGLILT